MEIKTQRLGWLLYGLTLWSTIQGGQTAYVAYSLQCQPREQVVHTIPGLLTNTNFLCKTFEEAACVLVWLISTPPKTRYQRIPIACNNAY